MNDITLMAIDSSFDVIEFICSRAVPERHSKAHYAQDNKDYLEVAQHCFPEVNLESGMDLINESFPILNLRRQRVRFEGEIHSFFQTDCPICKKTIVYSYTPWKLTPQILRFILQTYDDSKENNENKTT